MTDEEVRWLREQVQRQNDIEEIKQLKARYCRYADGQDWEKWGQLLTEDFHFDSDGGTQDGRDTVVAFVSKSLDGASTVHHCHMPEITMTGPDTATGIWAMQDHVKMVHAGTPIMFRGAGHYLEEYVRTGEGWRIKSTTLRRLSIDPLQPPEPSQAAAGEAGA